MTRYLRVIPTVLLLVALACSAGAIEFCEVDGRDVPGSAATSQEGAPRFVAGPYLQNMTANSVTVMWQTDVPSLGVLALSDSKNVGNYKTKSPRRLHEVQVTGLLPNTSHAYYVSPISAAGGRDGVRTSGRFRTFPVARRRVTFLVYGDSRTHPDRHETVVDAMKREQDVDFVLHTGDFVGDGRNLDLWVPEFFEPMRGLGYKVPYFTAIGNHENNSDYYFQYFALPGNERYYSFDLPDVLVITLDSCTDFDDGSEQYQWLVAELERHRDVRWKFLVIHHPVYTSGNHGAVDKNGVPKERPIRLAQKLVPSLADKYGITAVFSGHDHTYERSVRDGVLYIVTGGGGAPTYGEPNAKSNPYRKVFYAGLNYCVVTVDGDVGELVVKTPGGKVIDRVEMKAR